MMNAMTNNRAGPLVGLLAALLALGSARQAQGATLNPCPGSFIQDGTAKVHDGLALPGVETAASACQYLTPPSSSTVANEANVNAAGFFGTTTWDSLVKVDLSGAGLTGNWSIPGAVDFAKYSYMLTFKSGADTNLISFLLNGEFSSGGWSTPFTNPPFSVRNPKDVSHWAVFRSENVVSVPEPDTLLLSLFGFGLVAFGFRSMTRPSS